MAWTKKVKGVEPMPAQSEKIWHDAGFLFVRPQGLGICSVTHGLG